MGRPRFGRIEEVNKELWLVLSVFAICLLLNLVVDAQQMVLSFYTLPTLGSAYLYGRRHATLTALASVLLSAAALGLAACGGGTQGQAGRESATGRQAPAGLADTDIMTVQKAECGPGSRPETGLQGQVPAALRQAGFQGFSCNLELVGQSRNEGGSWQTAYFQNGDKRKCAYYDSASTAVIPGKSSVSPLKNSHWLTCAIGVKLSRR